MNNKIANILKGKIETLSWVDKIAGLVQTVSKRESIGETFVNKTFPVSCDVDYDACIKGRYQDLTPDSKKKSVVYFEDRGISMIERKGNTIRFRSQLRLVCWLSLKKINSDACDSDVELCAVSGDYVIEVIKALPTIPFNEQGFIGLYVSDISQAIRSVDIFSKYTYNEQSTQYLLFPYDFFALDITVNFTIPCIST